VFAQGSQSHSIGDILMDAILPSFTVQGTIDTEVLVSDSILVSQGGTLTAVAVNTHINTTGLIAAEKIVGTELVGGCKEGFARVNAEDYGTCIQKDAILEAGCVGDECAVRGLRSCSCMEIGQAFVNGVINPTDNSVNPAGEYCLGDVGHCQGIGDTSNDCITGSAPAYGKIWPHIAIQRPNWQHSGTLRPDNPQFLQVLPAPLCDQSKPPTGRVTCTHSNGAQSTKFPGHSCGYPYGSVRCCY